MPPPKTKTGLLVLLARMVSASCAWPLSGTKASTAANDLRRGEGTLYFHRQQS